MKENKIKGFTLIELLVVIAILAIIALIAMPIILNAIEESRDKSNMNSTYGLVKAAELYFAENMADGNVSFDTNLLDTLKVTGKKPDSGEVKINEKGEIKVNTQFGDLCYAKDYTEAKVKKVNCDGSSNPGGSETVTPGADGANVPTLNTNMVAVEIDDSGNLTVADTSNTNWYNYNESKWANAVVMKDGSKPAVGTKINETEINTKIKEMYVWIPRYKYSNITTSDKPITIEFIDKSEKGHTAFSLNNDDGTYTEISGIWVGKFESSFANGDETQVNADNINKLEFVIKPNMNSAHNLNVSQLYELTNNSKKPNFDVHLMKNTEWGAAAYLSQSKYGICEETTCTKKVQNNNYYVFWSFDIITGYGSNNDTNKTKIEETNRWTGTGNLSSTTHNTTGIYDMAGGRIELVMGNMYDSEDKTNLNVKSSGFDQTILNDLSSKYIDKYEYGISKHDTDRNILGDATVETNDWHDDASYFVSPSVPWFERGGNAISESNAGLWNYSTTSGVAYPNCSARAAVFGQ